MRISSISAAMATIISSGIAALPALGQTAVPPYQLSVFAAAPTGLTAPDSIAVLRDHVFVGYGDGNKPDGSDGKKTANRGICDGRHGGAHVFGSRP